MSSAKGLSRRRFVQQASVSLGAPVLATASRVAAAPGPMGHVAKAQRLPREVWVASISQNGLRAGTAEEMTHGMLARMEAVAPFEPDVVCLPEVFPFANLSKGRPPLAESVEEPIGRYSRPFAQFAARHRCYVVCPTYTVVDGRYYNSAVFIDRQGQYVGQYRKMHPTIGELEKGIMPGPAEPPVFKTDFGMVGAQICFDIEWYDGWRRLRAAGAEMVFWPSAFAGGSMVNTHAWQNKCCVVSSTRKGTTKICDIDGQTVAATGHFADWVCAPVNLEKVFLHTWPYCKRFSEIQARYGRKISIRTYYEEEWTIIESRSPEVRVADVLKEFDLKTHEEHIGAADRAQRRYRQKMRQSDQA